MDAIRYLVEYVFDTEFEDLPQAVVLSTKRSIIDTLAAMLGGTTAEGCQEIINQIQQWGGKEESTLFNCQGKVPAYLAALANATMARAIDYDEIFEPGNVHTSASVIPVAFATAEKMGGVSGRDLLTAIAIGIDLVCRMSLTNRIPPGVSGMNVTFQYAHFATAAVAGKIMKLDAEKLQNAMGLAYTQTAGNSQNVAEGTLATRLNQGLAAQSGVFSAIFANIGITAAKNVLEGKFGYYNTYQRGEYDSEKLLDGLGTVFNGPNVTNKLYPCCMHTHAAIDATICLTEKYNLNSQDIEKVEVGLTQQGYNFVCSHLEKKREPKTVAEAQFSLPYVVSVALLHKGVKLADFRQDAIKCPEIKAIAGKIDCAIDQELTSKYKNYISPAIVQITTKDGKTLNKAITQRKCSPKDPCTLDEISNKLLEMSRYAKNYISDEQITSVIGMINTMEKMEDGTKIIKVLSDN